MNNWRVPYPKFGQGVGLDRVRAVAKALHIDLSAFGAQGAVVTGSNGKGSTTAMLASVLDVHASPVGRFTSPHLFVLNERFAIDGENISDEELEVHWRRVIEAIDATRLGDEIGGFEFLFLIAASWFAMRGCVHTIWEAGIGGRFDPVRLIEAQTLALTSLDLEHAALLGDTLEAIAFDKIDAAPAGAALFVGPLTLALRDKVTAYALQKQLKVTFPAETDAPLAGAHQRANAALAVAMARRLAPGISDAEIARGLAATRWPGRLEVIESAPLVVIDVGHTPDAIRAALDGFNALRGDRRAVLVCGASTDKNADEIVTALAPSFDMIICVAAHHKGRPAAEIAARVLIARPDADVVTAETMAEARKIALAKAGADGAMYVAGGLFLAIEFKAVHLGRDPAKLAFF